MPAAPPSVAELIDSFIDSRLDDYLKDRDTAAQIITWVSAETRLPRLAVRLAYHWLTPLVLAQARKIGHAALRSGVEALSERLAKLPGYDRISRAILALNRKLGQRVEEKQILDAILAGEARAAAAEDLTTLSFDQKLAFKQLAALEDIDAGLKEGFAAVLAHLRPQPLLVLDTLARTQANRHFYGVQRIPFVDRAQELDALQGFLSADKPFAWWAVCGPAGGGKRRLSLELCLRIATLWRGGVLPEDHGFEGHWAAWQPERPTLLVLHGAVRAEEGLSLAALLAQRSAELEWPVRLLLTIPHTEILERARLDDRRQRHVEAASYGPAFTVGGLPEEALWECVRSVLLDCGRFALPDRNDVLVKLARIDPEARPLYAAFAAEALAAGRDLGQLDRNDLVRHVLEQEQTAWAAAGVTETEKNLAAVATITEGLSLQVLKRPPVPDFFPAPAQYSPERYHTVAGGPGRSFLMGKDPAVLGDLFVLEHLEPAHDLDERPAQARLAVLEMDPSCLPPLLSTDDPEDRSGTAREARFQYFFERAAHHFPGHPTLAHLRQPPPPPGGSLFSWGLHTAGLIERLEAPENLDLCRLLYEDLQRAVLASDPQGPGTVRLRLADCTMQMLIRYANVPAPDRAEQLYADLETLAGIDINLAGRLISGRSVVVSAFALAGDLHNARRHYELLQGSERKDLSGEAGRFSLSMAALKLLQAHLRAGDYAGGQELCEDLRTMAKDPDPPLGVIRHLGEGLAALVVSASGTDDLEEACKRFEELAALAKRCTNVAGELANEGSADTPGLAQAVFALIQSSLGMRPSAPLSKAKEARDLELYVRALEMWAGKELIEGRRRQGDISGATQIHEALREIAPSYRQEPQVSTGYGAATITLLLGELYDAGDVEAAQDTFEELIEVWRQHPQPNEVVGYLAQGAFVLVQEHLAAGSSEAACRLAKRTAEILLVPEVRAWLTEMAGKDRAARFYVFVESCTGQ
jgi:hypothetical protein